MTLLVAGNLVPNAPIHGRPFHAPMTREHAVCELARDGAWTVRQLQARLAGWECPPIDAYIARSTEPLRPTAWTRHRQSVEVVRLNPRGVAIAASQGVSQQLIRAGELEHALGLAELRWRCGVPCDRYTGQDGLGRTHRQELARGGREFGSHLADGVFRTRDGTVLAEYDHGRYTAKQVRMKLAAFRSVQEVNGQPIVGAVWGAPTARRAAWLKTVGVGHVVILEHSTWLA